MSIQVFCPKCKTSSGLDADICSKCKKSFGRNRQYRVQVSVKGKRVTRVVDNLTIAREIESALKADLVREEFDITHHKTRDVLTLDALWERYLPWAKENKKTWRCDQYNYETHLKPRWENKALEALSSMDIERLKLDLKRNMNKFGRPFTPATIKHQLVLLKRLYNLAKRWRLYSGPNPMDYVEMPHVDNQITEFLTDEELSRLLVVLDNWPFDDSAAFVRLALYTGLRKSALFRLQWTDVDFDHGTITPVPKGKKKTQTIPVSDEALAVLRGLNVTSSYVFPGKDGKQRVDFKGPWQRIRKAAGLPPKFRFHGLRHNFASTLVSNGTDLFTVQGLLCHEDSRTTARYSHLMPGALQRAAQKAGELLSPKAKNEKVLSIVK